MLLGSMEAGGTKMVLCIGDEEQHIFERETISTTSPEETMEKILAFFQGKGIRALGIGSFGPLDLNRRSSTYGYITTTPKTLWRNFPLLPQLRSALRVPVEIDTDVNAAALSEYALGAAQGFNSCLYVTVGTGIGGGRIAEGNLVHGLVHPEFGHMLLRVSADDPMPDGVCPYHKGCLEGLACGPAIEARWDKKPSLLPEGHKAWELEAEYLAQMCANAIFCISPECIVLGGGVMRQTHLFPMIRARTLDLLKGYVQHPRVLSGMEDYIVPPALGENSGIVGGLLLAKRAFQGL